MKRSRRRSPLRPIPRPDTGDLTLAGLDFHAMVGRHPTPAQRLERSWRLRRLLPDPQKVHDAKLWPRP
ncbi:MAG: hypothetical protein HYY93_01600 [Planctomycetes bacterium]|nr:hypothetical protein [Planctomycetota bacterium]